MNGVSKFCFAVVHGSVYGLIAGILICKQLGWPTPWITWLTLFVAYGLSAYIRLFEEERWKDATRYTRLTRWLVFRPKRFLQFCFWIFLWVCCGAKPLVYDAVVEDEWPGIQFNRRETIKHFWTISVSMYQYDCQNFLTIQECRDELKAAYANNLEKTAD